MRNATSVTLRVQQHSEYKFGINYQIRFCLNGTDEDVCQNSTSTDDLDLKETLDDLNCNNSYNVYIVWISADMIECCLREASDIRSDCSGMNQCIILSYGLVIIIIPT